VDNAKLVTQNYNIVAPGDEYEHVFSFFKKASGDETMAGSFAASLYEISETTEVPVLEILESFKGDDLLTLTETMAYYMNGLRSKTALLGIKHIVTSNYYASRNVLS
jgi:hypothetical protein